MIALGWDTQQVHQRPRAEIIVADLWKVTAKWTGGSIGSGFSNFYFTAGVGSAQQAMDAARKFLSDSYSAGAGLPAGVNISFDPIVTVLAETNGQISNVLAVTAGITITGSDTTRYAAVAGACVTWRTGIYLGGRKVRGRTFLVPLGGLALQNDGTVDTTFLGFINNAAAALVAAAPELVVWKRPSGPAAVDGVGVPVIGGTCSDKTAFLSSRR